MMFEVNTLFLSFYFISLFDTSRALWIFDYYNIANYVTAKPFST